MDVLLKSGVTGDEIASLAQALVQSGSFSELEQAVSSVAEMSVPKAVLGEFLTKLAKEVATIENLSLRMTVTLSILKLAEAREIGGGILEIRDLYASSLEANEMFLDAAKFIAEWTEPEDEFDILRWYLRIGSDFFNGGNCDAAFSYLNKASQHIYRLRTPTELLEKYDTLRGNIHTERLHFQEASRAWASLWKCARDPDLQKDALRKAAICAVLAPASHYRMVLLHQIMEDERTHTLDVYPMLDLISKRKFINKAARDDFRAKASNLVPMDAAMRAMERSATQDNITVAQTMFTTVGINRLAQLIGDTQDNVEAQLSAMIDAKRLDAVIDQPEKMVVFLPDKEKRDRDILRFCTTVQEWAIHHHKP